MIKVKRIIAFCCTVLLISALFSGCGGQIKYSKLEKIFDYVFDAGTYTSLDYEFAENFFKDHYDNFGGGCTAVAKVTNDNTMLIGRNLDLNISNKASYVVRTKVKGSYDTIGLLYNINAFAPDYENIVKYGVDENFKKIIPFLCDDVMNSEGLYVEINMRNAECWSTGEQKFTCSGTNPDSKTRVYMFCLPRYIAQNCATVSEAVEYVKTLDIYSMSGYNTYCFMLADASGHYGVLEFAQNKIIWHDGQKAQTNFYIDKKMAEIEELKCGVGRYETVMKGVKSVQKERDMLTLMNKVTYFQVYSPDICKFDPRSESVAIFPFCTYDFIMAEENRELVMTAMKLQGEYVNSMTRKEIQNLNKYWGTAYTVVANCTDKTLFVRFFEDNTRAITLDFK